MPAVNTQKLITDIQRAGLEATIDVNQDGSILCLIMDKPDRYGAQEVLARQQGKTLHKTILRCWMQISKSHKSGVAK